MNSIQLMQLSSNCFFAAQECIIGFTDCNGALVDIRVTLSSGMQVLANNRLK